MADENVRTDDERLVSDALVRALREGVEACGEAVLLVPSVSQAVRAQKALADRGHLTLAVKSTTPSMWVRDGWEVWGDGRHIADGATLTVLAYETIREAPPEVAGPVTPLPGMVSVVARLVGRALPWLPVTDEGTLDEARCKGLHLTVAETALVRLAAVLGGRLAELGYVSAAEAMATLPDRMGQGLPHVVVAGYQEMTRAERALMQALAQRGRLTLVTGTLQGPSALAERLLLDELGFEASPLVEEGASGPCRSEAMDEVLGRLFAPPTSPMADPPVEMLHAAGPLAEPELLARRLAALVEQDPTLRILVAVPDAERTWRELMPKLEERNVSARITWRQPLLENEHARAFMAFAASVAHLVRLDATWPEPTQGKDGMVQRLGDMSWWPPREIVDFLFEDMAHMDPERVWNLDARWRGNRLLTPGRVLEMLRQERMTSSAVSQATFELMRGRLGAACAKLIAPYGWADTGGGDSVDNEARSVLQTLLGLAGTLRSLGVRYDPEDPERHTVEDLVSLWGQAAQGSVIVNRVGVGPNERRAQIEFADLTDASRFEQGSVDHVVVCGLTSQEQPIRDREGVLEAILVSLGIEPARDPLVCARARFRSLLGVASRGLVLERTLKDADGAECYPSCMLSELLCALGREESELAGPARSERLLSENLSATGVAESAYAVCEPAPAGWIQDGARHLIFVPQPGKLPLEDGLPVLSASQVEAYLDCPYKWFSQRRLGLAGTDATHGPAEMGTFAHRVLEVTHTELLLRAIERERAEQGLPEVTDAAERLALIKGLEADPCRHIAGSAVTDDNLGEATDILLEAFDRHLEHMYLEHSPRRSMQLLVAHDTNELAQEERLRSDLVSVLSYETRILRGFEPRFFEWGFGRRGELVRYAGAYFVGTVDRIDVSPHGTAVIVDYKHKGAAALPGEYDALTDGVLEGVELPHRVQSLIYAQVVRRAFEGRLRVVGSFYLSTRAPHALAGVADENVCDLAFERLSAQREARVSVPAGSDRTSGMHELLDQTEELIAVQVRRMLAGDIEARPRDLHSCEYCPVAQCERRVAR